MGFGFRVGRKIFCIFAENSRFLGGRAAFLQKILDFLTKTYAFAYKKDAFSAKVYALYTKAHTLLFKSAYTFVNSAYTFLKCIHFFQQCIHFSPSAATCVLALVELAISRRFTLNLSPRLSPSAVAGLVARELDPGGSPSGSLGFIAPALCVSLCLSCFYCAMLCYHKQPRMCRCMGALP